MKILRVYVDTSVLGGCFDPEFARWSLGLMEDFRSGVYVPVLSDVTGAEAALAPGPVRALHEEIAGLAPPALRVTAEALAMVGQYAARGILGPRYRNDMLHIALASITEVDVLVSWNFRHIVRLDRIRLFNGVNIELGYRPLAIRSPREVTTYGRED